MSETRYIGRRARSKEAPRHVIGRGQYVDDYRFPGMLHAMVVRSPYAHARILNVDVSAALSLQGVRAALTPADIRHFTKPFKPGRYSAGLKHPIPEYSVAMEKVRYVGEPVAILAARDRATAEDAAELVQVDYQALPPAVDVNRAAEASAPLLFEELGSNVAWTGTVRYGDVDKAFREADRVVEQNLRIHRYSSTPLEPFACIANFDSGAQKLMLWCNAQVPEVIYDGLTEALGLEDVRVLIPDVGGGFGQKIHLIRKYMVLASLLSIRTGRPVKWIEDRSEHMMAAGHSCDQQFHVKAAVRRDGVVLGLHVTETDDVGGSVSTLTIHFTNKLNNLVNTYRTEHVLLEGRSVVTNRCPVVPNRGIGKPGMCFIWERTMDLIARELKMEPHQVRFANLIPAEAMPYTTPNGNIYDSGDYPGLLRRALERIDYEGFRKRQQGERERGKYLGISVVVGVEPGGRNAARDMAVFPNLKEMPGSGGVNGATIKMERNGSITLMLGSPNCGQAHETTTCQVAAEILGIAPEHISVATPFDSDLSPWGVSSANSGNNFHLYDIGAVQGAATQLRERILALASHVLQAPADGLDIRDGAVHSTGGTEARVTLAELGKIAYGNQSRQPRGGDAGLQVTYYYTFPHAQPFMVPGADQRVRAQFTFSAAAHAAIVEVDIQTGRVTVVRYLIVGDNGTIINPDVVNGQIHGSVAHGISIALGEGFVYNDEGQLVTITLTDYGKSSTWDTPRVEIEHRPSPSPFTALGQKAAGEGATIPSPAVIASAIEDALQPFGIEIRELPLSPNILWNKIKEAQAFSRG